jgi:hypothetical protein
MMHSTTMISGRKEAGAISHYRRRVLALLANRGVP